MTDTTNEVAATTTTDTTGAAPSSTEPAATSSMTTQVTDTTTTQVADIATGTTTVAIPAAAHVEAQGIFSSLAEKLANFEHALAADCKAELEKLKTLLHL